jgi:HPt (histidine-containing phosphotransfer) domain-containing protein
MNDYLSKPLSLPALAEALQRYGAAPLGASPAASPERPAENARCFDPTVLDRLKADLEPDGARALAGLLDRYVVDVPQQMSALRASLDAGLGEPTSQLAHTAKSNAAMFGLSRLAHWLREVERLSSAGRLAEASEALAQAEAAQAEAQPDLAAYRARL